MNEVLINVIGAVVTAVVLPLITLGINALIKWLSQKTKNEKLTAYLSSISEIVINSVKATAQTYVSSLKKSGNFDAEAQKIAFEMAKETALSQINEEAINHISIICGDFNKWLETQIEANIAAIKDK